MRLLLVHPSPLMYSEIYLRLEPIGLERVAAAARAAGHRVRILDLQIFRHRDYHRELETFEPDAIGFSLNYLVNVPEVLDLAVAAKRRLTTLDYRLFDVQHAVLPTRLPLMRFYEELVRTQAVLSRKHLGVAALRRTAGSAIALLLRGQTNFLRMPWKFSRVYNPDRQYADRFREVKYTMRPPPTSGPKPSTTRLYVHAPAATIAGGQERTPR